MAVETEKGATHGRSIVFKIGFEGKPDKTIEAMAYLFARGSRLLAAAPLKDGQAQFAIGETELKGARLFIGPVLPPERYGTRPPTPESMIRVQAYEPSWHYRRGQRVYELLPVPERLWPWWKWCGCRVRGRLVKPVNTGGVIYEVPVCHARVHVCEVDRLKLLIPRLPDRVLRRLRDELLRVLERPPRPPEPDPGPIDLPFPPEPDPYLRHPGVADTSRSVAHRRAYAQRIIGTAVPRGAAMLGPQPEPPDRPPPWSIAAGNPQPEPPLRSSVAAHGPQPEPPDMPHAASLDTLAAAARAGLLSDALPVVRDALVANADLLRPWICLWDWLWPYFYPCDELAVLSTDEHGRFEAVVFYECFGDHPDLYFWVEFPIDGTWTTVYKPTIRCHTYWNYACGSEVTIRVTDERVAGCWEHAEVTGKKLVVLSIGPDVGMNDINRDTVPALEGTGKAGEVLPYPYPSAFPEWATKEVAFGHVLEPRVDFGSGLKEANITHYRWSWRPVGTGEDWQPMLAQVKRHYRVATLPSDPIRYSAVTIGPDEHGLFLISPELPADGETWAVLNEHVDLASAHFDTTVPEVREGKFELKLELFRIAGGAAQRIDLTVESVTLAEATSPAPFLASEILTAAPTADRRYEEEVAPGDSHLFGYRLVLHIDNRVCFGTINDVTLAGLGAGACGFLEYDPAADPEQTATLSFRASHPGNFAAFDFDTTRVATHLPALSVHQLVEDTAENGFTRLPGSDTFSKTVGVRTTLLADTECVRAAFAETLWVYALITNGYRRLAELDAPRSWEDANQIGARAFAVAPQEPAP
jgi:hypothetical protein